MTISFEFLMHVAAIAVRHPGEAVLVFTHGGVLAWAERSHLDAALDDLPG